MPTEYLLQDEKIFLRFLGTEAWPMELDTLWHNMLCTTTMVDQLTDYSGNDACFLRSLLDAFWLHYVVKAKIDIEKNRVDGTGARKCHHDQVNNDISSNAHGDESHASFCHTTESINLNSGISINREEQARPDWKALMETIRPTYLFWDFSILYNRGSHMKNRYWMNSARSLPQLSHTPCSTHRRFCFGILHNLSRKTWN